MNGFFVGFLAAAWLYMEEVELLRQIINENNLEYI
jgi:hypothetical protein